MQQDIHRDEPDMESVYLLYKDAVFRMAFTYVKNREDAWDITQEVFLKLFSKDVKFENEEHKKRWLLRVTANYAKDYLKSFYVSKRQEFPENEVAGPQENIPGEDDREVWDVLFSLPEKNRAVIYLHYYEGYTYEEIAKILKIRLSAVKMRAKRGIEKMRTAMSA